jgi:hypothetical protein
MNQPFSSQDPTNIVGATLAVALVTLTNAVALVNLTSKRRQKRAREEGALISPAKLGSSNSHSRG